MSTSIWANIPAADHSESVLQSIFGVNVSTILNNTEPTTLFGYLFSYYNTGLLAIVFVIYAFIIIIGTVNTAKDGQFLGRNWSGHWIPLRAIFGSVAAIPFKSGYCMAQYLIFAMVASGISFADYLWMHIVTEVVNGKVPPVVSTSVNDTIKGDLSIYMMSQLTQSIVNNPKFIGNGKLCSKENNAISCNISYQAPVTSDFIKAYAIPINHGTWKGWPTDIKFIQDDWEPFIKRGMTAWSLLNTANNYVQVQLTNATWNGTYVIPSMDKNQAQQNLTKLSHQYGDFNTKDFLNNPDKISVPKGLDDATRIIIKSLESKQSTIMQKCQFDDTNNICYKAKNYGWWDADQLYLSLDNSLSGNLQNLYNNFNDFSKSLNSGLSNTQVPVTYKSIKLEFETSYTPLSAFSGGGSYSQSDTFKPHTSSDPSSATMAFSGYNMVNLSHYTNLKKTNTFAVSLSNVRDTFNKIIYKAYNVTNKTSCATNSDCSKLTSQVNSLITDGVEFKYAQYLYILSSIAQSAYNNYINNNDTITPTPQQLIEIIIQPTLNLFTFFQANNVNFATDSGKPNTNGVTDPAENLLSNIFKRLLGGSAVSGSSVGGLLKQIYNIGNVEDQGQGFAAKNFSMIQNVQSVGMALIEGTISDMLDIFATAKLQLSGIKNDADQKISNLESDSVNASIINAVTFGMSSSITQNVMSLKFAEAMYHTTMKLASFTLSLIWMPMVLFVLTTIFGIGVSFTLIIPLTPFILFWAGKVAWLLLAIEAMVAAPIVALGLVYPEGHEVFGKTEPAIQICMNLVLRPVFMIVGMIAGIGLTYILIQFSSEGFKAVTNSLLSLLPVGDGTDAATYSRGVLSCLVIFIYATFLAMAFTKCFSLIYVIPDKVLQWIGNTRSERAGEAEIQEFKGATTQMAQQGAQAGGSTLNEGLQAQKSYTQSATDGAYKVGEAESNKNMAIGNTAGSIGKSIAKSGMNKQLMT
ncbi:MAG: hypothetical protein EP298_05405 [Gammaproteobacteria bacterium]|nr:MAG: hypothetical protein EP298_05405 [Gammaproteobacteria bacterium]UTW43233.1 DotA/TraY family protein [bacterium SCSIO 12844]